MTTLEEHAKRLEEMKAAEQRVRKWLDDVKFLGALDRRAQDVALLLERIDAYEASIAWHTDCLTCPKLYDQIYEMDQHTIPKFRELLKRVLDDARISGADQVSDETKKAIREALVVKDAPSPDRYEEGVKAERARIVKALRDAVAKDKIDPDRPITEIVMAIAKGTLLGFADRIEAGTT
jgi:hypothetical protein